MEFLVELLGNLVGELAKTISGLIVPKIRGQLIWVSSVGYITICVSFPRRGFTGYGFAGHPLLHCLLKRLSINSSLATVRFVV